MVRNTMTLLVLALVSAFDPRVIAQEPEGAEFPVNSYTTDRQYRPAVASDAAGNFVVVWYTYGQDGSGTGVAGQRFDRQGNPRGSEFLVNTYSTGNQQYPAVAVDASGGFVVAWSSSAQDGSGDGVFARRYDAAGTPLDAAEFRVNAYTTGPQARPDVAYDSVGNFVVVWDSYGQDGNYQGIFGRRFSATGIALGGELQVNAYTTGEQDSPRLAMVPDGSFVVAWHSFGPFGEIYARRFDASGNPLGSELHVNSFTTGTQRHPDVAVDGSGNFVVVWWGNEISGQRFDAGGNPLAGEFAVNTYTTSFQYHPSVAREADGRFVVAWESYRQDGDGEGVIAQRFDAGGAKIGSEFLVNSYTTGRQLSTAVASLGPESFVVAWVFTPFFGEADIFARLYGDLIFHDGFETGDARAGRPRPATAATSM